MEHADGRTSLNKYFHILTDMIPQGHRTIKTSRIKFEIQNLEDLRNNNWKARRAEAVPKTMDQIQWETDQEQQMINYQTRQNNKEDRQRGNQGKELQLILTFDWFLNTFQVVTTTITNVNNLNKTATAGQLHKLQNLALSPSLLTKSHFQRWATPQPN